MSKMNKMIIHYCGGAGINVSKEVNHKLSSLGDGFCEVQPRYIDTSVNNASSLPPETTFWKVDSGGFSEEEIAGSGGERRTNSGEIIQDLKKYLDTYEYTNMVTSEFHVVVFSASGGTGSVIAPMLISNLRTRNIPVLGIMIGDSSNGLGCKNTLNTMATLDHMAKNSLKKPITIAYYNNHRDNGASVNVRETNVNNNIFETLRVMSLFLSGANEDIDSKDMINFLAPDNYETITVNPSLYCVNIHTKGKVTNDPDCVNIIGRTLSCDGDNPNLDLTLLQHKYGVVTAKNAAENISGITPIHMVLAGNCLVTEHAALKNTVEEYDNIMNSITTTTLDGAGNADDSGMIF